MTTTRISLLLALLCIILFSCSTQSTPTYSLTTTVSPEESGTVSPVMQTYDKGTDVQISASPAENWVFQQWQGDFSGSSNPATIKMTSDKDITGIFVKRDYPLTIETEGEGTVSETVVQPKTTEYAHGTVIELTATAANGWNFVEWQGDLSGNENPQTVTVNEAMTITALFEPQQFPLTVETEGEGSVEEVIVQSKTTSYAFGTEVQLTATAADGWGFRAWKEDISSTKNPLTVEIAEGMELTAVFNECVNVQCLDIYYTQPSYLNRKNYFYYENSAFHAPLEAVVLNYDQDGIMDFVHTNSDYEASFNGQEIRNNILFYKGDDSDNLTIDNSQGTFSGLVHGRKGVVGDFNNNGYPDIFFAGHGADVHPFPGEYPIMLLNNEGNGFTETRFENLVGFWHSVTSGDVNNDGNLDIVLVDPQLKNGGGYILLNDGFGNFTANQNLINSEIAGAKFTSELFDINEDEFLDLIVTGHDYEGSLSAIIYGKSNDFNGEQIFLPTRTGYGVAVDFQFFDINEDGDYEIIINRTGDPENGLGFYAGWFIQVLELSGGEYVDATDKYISDNFQEDSHWIAWLHISDRNNDGTLQLYSNEVNYTEPRFEWELVNKKFVRVN